MNFVLYERKIKQNKIEANISDDDNNHKNERYVPRPVTTIWCVYTSRMMMIAEVYKHL